MGAAKPRERDEGKVAPLRLDSQHTRPAPLVLGDGLQHSDDTVSETFSFLTLFPSFFLPSCLLSSLFPFSFLSSSFPSLLLSLAPRPLSGSPSPSQPLRWAIFPGLYFYLPLSAR